MRVMRFLQGMCLSFFRAPIGWGDPERGPLSAKRSQFFGGVRSRLFVLLQKAKPPICEGNRNPPGWNCRAQAPSAGITLKQSPDERD
jgi:hypothetical protein